MAASGCLGEVHAGAELNDSSNKHRLDLLETSQKNSLKNGYGLANGRRLACRKNELKLPNCIEESVNVVYRKGMKNGVVTSFVLNNCSSLKISPNNCKNGDIHYKNGRNLICDPASRIHRLMWAGLNWEDGCERPGPGPRLVTFTLCQGYLHSWDYDYLVLIIMNFTINLSINPAGLAVMGNNLSKRYNQKLGWNAFFSSSMMYKDEEDIFHTNCYTCSYVHYRVSNCLAGNIDLDPG
ncbi:hypothetical protein GQR58_016666 [Nymphon striatum]|nr:hypothetical protein GQR58_016666 [Nymphon striatum]